MRKSPKERTGSDIDLLHDRVQDVAVLWSAVRGQVMLFRDERRHGRGFAVVDVRLATRQPTRLTSLEGNITDIMEIALRVVLKADGCATREISTSLST